MANMRDRFVNVSTDLLDHDERLFLLLADIGPDRFAAQGVFERHPQRALNVGIREQLLVSVGGGVALEGFRPILHTYAPFLVERPFEQLKLDFVHQGVGGIFVSVGASYDWAAGGRTHQCPGDIALLQSLPGWSLHVPGHPDEVEDLLRAAATSDNCAYIRLAEAQNCVAHHVADSSLVAIRRGTPSSPTVIAVGPMLDAVLAATTDLDATVLYTATPYPLDANVLRQLASGHEVAIVEPYLEGASSAQLSAAFSDVAHRFLAIGVRNTEHRRYGDAAEHDRAHGLDPAGIRARLDAFLK